MWTSSRPWSEASWETLSNDGSDGGGGGGGGGGGRRRAGASADAAAFLASGAPNGKGAPYTSPPLSQLNWKPS